MTQTRKIIFGCGYLGRRVADRWRDAGARVSVVTRDAARAERLAEAGLEPLVADVTQPETLRSLGDVSTALFAVGYDRTSPHSIEQVYVDGLAHVLEALPSSTERFIYVSSTGVYGPADDDWVDESTPCLPTRAGGRACLKAGTAIASRSAGPTRNHLAISRHLRSGTRSTTRCVGRGQSDRSAIGKLLESDPRGGRRDVRIGSRKKRPSAQYVHRCGWSPRETSRLLSGSSAFGES